MKRILLVLLLSGAALAISGARAQSSATQATVDEDESVSQQAVDALWWNDFDELQRLHDRFQQPGQRTAAGHSRLVLFRKGLQRVLKGPDNARDAYYSQMDALTLEWARTHPDSAFAHVLHAQALSNHGWWYRGGEYAAQVPPDAMRTFERYVASAIDYLAEHRAVAFASSSADVLLLDLETAVGTNNDILWPIAQAGLALNVDDEGLYRGMVTASLPRWGGSAARLAHVIDDFARISAPLHGDIFYARMYAWASDWEYGSRLFAESQASWPRMKKGFEQQLQRYPGPAAVNSFAVFACMARDRPVAVDMLDRIGAAPMLDVWGTNGGRTFETCRQWVREPEAPASRPDAPRPAPATSGNAV